MPSTALDDPMRRLATPAMVNRRDVLISSAFFAGWAGLYGYSFFPTSCPIY
jgi:hypothetical protein